jgi:hypothetical protein
LRNYGGSALTQADWAARLDTPDWEVLRRVQTDGVDLVLPELGPLRILATALQVRFRAEVAERHFDDAVRTAKTMFALARHLGVYPTGAANLLGLSIADLALDTLEEMLRQAGCPNFYWALTDLPCPLVDLRQGLQGDCALVEAELRPLRDDAALMEAEMEEVVSRLSGAMGFAREQAGQAPRNLRAALAAQAQDPERVRAARERLVKAGLSAALVGRFPTSQVILLDEKRAYEVSRDERMKLRALPLWQIDGSPGGEDLRRGGDSLFADFLPHVLTVCRAQGRLEQRIALLRHVEALRLYAAAHDGRPPAALADVTVPLPPDPFTGKPFGYLVGEATGHLRGQAKDPAFNIRYEITIRKPGGSASRR